MEDMERGGCPDIAWLVGCIGLKRWLVFEMQVI